MIRKFAAFLVAVLLAHLAPAGALGDTPLSFQPERNPKPGPWYVEGSYGLLNPDDFTDIIGRHFRQPPEGLGFDGSPTAHMWRSIIWPDNFL